MFDINGFYLQTADGEDLLDLHARLTSASESRDIYVRRRDPLPVTTPAAQQDFASGPPLAQDPARPIEPGLVLKLTGSGMMLECLVALIGRPREEVCRCFNFCDYDFELARAALAS
jgi:hypothetical protein